MRVRRARFRGTVERHGEALGLLQQPGDMVLVERGLPRLLLMACPDGCGDALPVNLDPRAGKAWRLYPKGGTRTLYPSVWREEGCGAHFILWDDIIYWSDAAYERTAPATLRAAVLQQLLAESFRSFFDIALDLDEIPWAVQVACRKLVEEGIAEEGRGLKRGSYRLIDCSVFPQKDN